MVIVKVKQQPLVKYVLKVLTVKLNVKICIAGILWWKCLIDYISTKINWYWLSNLCYSQIFLHVHFSWQSIMFVKLWVLNTHWRMQNDRTFYFLQKLKNWNNYFKYHFAFNIETYHKTNLMTVYNNFIFVKEVFFYIRRYNFTQIFFGNKNLKLTLISKQARYGAGLTEKKYVCQTAG